MEFEFTGNEKENIINRFGIDLFNHIYRWLPVLIERWQINQLELINSYSSSIVFKGNSTLFEKIIRKFGTDKKEFLNEANALQYLNGALCEVYDIDEEIKVLLAEAILPGEVLKKEAALEKRLNIFCDSFKRLHIDHNRSFILEQSNYVDYPSYSDWIFRITNFMIQKVDWEDVALHMNRAKNMFVALSKTYNSKELLHGDLHYYNILKGKRGYKIIDPKGVTGDPVFDLPRYILNEFWDENDESQIDEKMRIIFNHFKKELNTPRDVITRLLYIEACLAIGWCIESGAELNEKSKFNEILKRIYSYI